MGDTICGCFSCGDSAGEGLDISKMVSLYESPTHLHSAKNPTRPTSAYTWPRAAEAGGVVINKRHARFLIVAGAARRQAGADSCSRRVTPSAESHSFSFLFALEWQMLEVIGRRNIVSSMCEQNSARMTGVSDERYNKPELGTVEGKEEE